MEVSSHPMPVPRHLTGSGPANAGHTASRQQWMPLIAGGSFSVCYVSQEGSRWCRSLFFSFQHSVTHDHRDSRASAIVRQHMQAQQCKHKHVRSTVVSLRSGLVANIFRELTFLLNSRPAEKQNSNSESLKINFISFSYCTTTVLV